MLCRVCVNNLTTPCLVSQTMAALVARAPGMAHPPPRCVARRSRPGGGGGCGGGDGGAAGARRAAGTERGDLAAAFGKKKKQGFADELMTGGAGAPGVGDVLKQAEAIKANVRALFAGEKEEAAADMGTESEKRPVGAVSDADKCPCGGGAPGLPYSRCGRADIARRLLYLLATSRDASLLKKRGSKRVSMTWRARA